MSTFAATTTSDAVVPADRLEIWKALTDPDLLPRLTPLLRGIDVHESDGGELWTWHLTRITALGVSMRASFTERMRFENGRRIEYVHEPPPGVHERAGARGVYDLSDVDGGTRLRIKLTLTVDLPLPSAAAPAVRRIMRATMNRTGDRFSANLLAHLGVS